MQIPMLLMDSVQVYVASGV